MKQSTIIWILVFSSLGLCVSGTQAGEVKYDSGIDTEYVDQSIDSEQQGKIDSSNVIIAPYLRLTYTARDLVSRVQATHSHVRRSLDTEDITNNYTNLTGSINYDIVKNLITLSASGSQQYRALGAQSFLVDDFLLNADSLVKTQTLRSTVNFNLPTGEWFGTNASLSYFKTDNESEGQELSTGLLINQLKNESYSATWGFNSGQDIRPVVFDFNSTAQLTKRSQQGDYESATADLNVGFNVHPEFSVNVLTSYEANDIQSDNFETDETDSVREFYAYGLGFTWKPSTTRYIELAYNRSTTKANLFTEEDEENSFISVDTRWQVSQRTRLSGNYTRRFFGNSGSFTFSHAIRTWRSNITYRESVNSNTFLQEVQQDGIFVCNNGATDLSECSLPNSLDPDNLEDGQFTVPFVDSSFEFNDNIIIRKALTAQSSIKRRRTTIALSLSSSKDQQVINEGKTETDSAQLRVLFELGSRTNLVVLAKRAKSLQESFGLTGESDVTEASITIDRRLTRRFYTSVGFRYLDRDTDGDLSVGSFSGIQGPVTDKRITLALEYKFSSSK